VGVDGGCGGLDRRQSVVVVDGVEELDVQDRTHAGRYFAGEAHGAAVGRVLEGLGPALGARDDFHAVGSQRMQLAQAAADSDGLEVGVAGDEQEAVPRLQQVRRAADRIGAGDEVEERMFGDLLLALVEQQRHAGGGLCHHAHRAVDDGVLHEAFAGEGGVVARAPDG